jgi:hypothetical protein
VQEREELLVSVKRLKERIPKPPVAKDKKDENVKDNVG